MQKIIQLINSIIKKFMTKEVILYIVFGGLTTVVNVGTFYVLTTFCHVNENISNVIAIFLAVVFAYITNRRLVFKAKLFFLFVINGHSGYQEVLSWTN